MNERNLRRSTFQLYEDNLSHTRKANNRLKDGNIDRYAIDITAIDRSAKEYLFLVRRTRGFAHA